VIPLADQIVHNVSQVCDSKPDRIKTSGDRRPRRTPCAEAAAYATRGGRGVRYARTIVNVHHKI